MNNIGQLSKTIMSKESLNDVGGPHLIYAWEGDNFDFEDVFLVRANTLCIILENDDIKAKLILDSGKLAWMLIKNITEC